MSTEPRAGRPKASSRETLAEAACELFLERGYEGTSVAEIAQRAGVSRSSFFNYFSSKADILWGAFDERVDAAVDALADGAQPVRAVLAAIAAGLAPDTLALAIGNAGAMGLEQELERERAVRQVRLGRAVAERLRRDGGHGFAPDALGAAYAGGLLAALWRWADDGPGVTALHALVEDALSAVPAPAAGTVRQLRLVVQAPEFERALAFYRDALGMPQAEAYEADGGARVVILDAGRATLELANAAQVTYIDRVETDGVPSDRLRVAFEVDDTDEVVARLADAGAPVEATARETPWRSRNARLRGEAGVQLTIFQELDPET